MTTFSIGFDFTFHRIATVQRHRGYHSATRCQWCFLLGCPQRCHDGSGWFTLCSRNPYIYPLADRDFTNVTIVRYFCHVGCYVGQKYYYTFLYCENKIAILLSKLKSKINANSKYAKLCWLINNILTCNFSKTKFPVKYSIWKIKSEFSLFCKKPNFLWNLFHDIVKILNDMSIHITHLLMTWSCTTIRIW